MKQEATLIRAGLKTPRAAAVAGILFSVFLIAGLLLFRLSVRADPLEAGAWLRTSSNTIALCLNPFQPTDSVFDRLPGFSVVE